MSLSPCIKLALAGFVWWQHKKPERGRAEVGRGQVIDTKSWIGWKSFVFNTIKTKQQQQERLVLEKAEKRKAVFPRIPIISLGK